MITRSNLALLLLFNFLILYFFSASGQKNRTKDSRYSTFPNSTIREKSKSNEHIHLPIQNGAVIYEYTSLMDSSLSKERIYRAALNWFFKTFPYGKSRILISDPKEGAIRAREEFNFPYSVLWDVYSMRVHFILNCSIRYGKYRLQLKEIEVEDQVLSDGNYKTYKEFESRNLLLMYEQYLNMNDPPEFAVEKIEKIDNYFKNLVSSFKTQMKAWTKLEDDFK